VIFKECGGKSEHSSDDEIYGECWPVRSKTFFEKANTIQQHIIAIALAEDQIVEPSYHSQHPLLVYPIGRDKCGF
jgi:hypothetical protein